MGAAGVTRPADGRRQRRLTDDEYCSLGMALRTADEQKIWPSAVAAARFLAVTGWRTGEVLALQRSEVDLSRRTGVLVDTKTGRSMRPLSGAACEVLRGSATASTWMFPASRGTGQMSGFRSIWDRIAKFGELPPDVTPHVLRHSFASFGIRPRILGGDDRRVDRSQEPHCHRALRAHRKLGAAGGGGRSGPTDDGANGRDWVGQCRSASDKGWGCLNKGTRACADASASGRTSAKTLSLPSSYIDNSALLTLPSVAMAIDLGEQDADRLSEIANDHLAMRDLVYLLSVMCWPGDKDAVARHYNAISFEEVHRIALIASELKVEIMMSGNLHLAITGRQDPRRMIAGMLDANWLAHISCGYILRRVVSMHRNDGSRGFASLTNAAEMVSNGAVRMATSEEGKFQTSLGISGPNTSRSPTSGQPGSCSQTPISCLRVLTFRASWRCCAGPLNGSPNKHFKYSQSIDAGGKRFWRRTTSGPSQLTRATFDGRQPCKPSLARSSRCARLTEETAAARPPTGVIRGLPKILLV